MGKYGQVAKIATELLISNQVSDPIKAWDVAAAQVFPNSISSRNKNCPKNSFLGLCEDGYIANVTRGSYTRSEKNKNYAIKAMPLLNANPLLAEKELWKLVINEPDKKHNYQMDVVKTLWDNRYINQKNILLN